MVPRLRQEELHPPRPPLPKQGPSTGPHEAWEAALSDPFVLVLELLALACASERDVPPEESLASILPAVYVVAANQAALATVASREHQVRDPSPQLPELCCLPLAPGSPELLSLQGLRCLEP